MKEGRWALRAIKCGAAAAGALEEKHSLLQCEMQEEATVVSSVGVG